MGDSIHSGLSILLLTEVVLRGTKIWQENKCIAVCGWESIQCSQSTVEAGIKKSWTTNENTKKTVIASCVSHNICVVQGDIYDNDDDEAEFEDDDDGAYNFLQVRRLRQLSEFLKFICIN